MIQYLDEEGCQSSETHMQLCAVRGAALFTKAMVVD